MIDFFASAYITESARTDALFGICDDTHLAYSTISGNPDEWGAIVSNPKNMMTQFVPIDHNIIVHDDNGNEISQCDGMLYTQGKEWIAFVELKDVRKGWKRKPYEQLESTISLFLDNHDYRIFTKRYAYAVNKRHPHFAFSHKDEMQHFYQQYKFRLLYQRNIDIT